MLFPLVLSDNFNVMANRSSLLDSLTYHIDISCYDSNFDSGNGLYTYYNQPSTVNVTFSNTGNYKATKTSTVLIPTTQTTQASITPTAGDITTSSAMTKPLSTATGRTTSDKYGQYNFFGDVWNFVAVTTLIGIVVIVITAFVSIKGYKMYRTRVEGSSVIPL